MNLIMEMMVIYTIERLRRPEDFRKDIKKFMREEIPKISQMFGDSFNFNNCSIFDIASRSIFLICRRNGEVRGLLVAFLYRSNFDKNTKILQQQILYVKPDSGRTAYHLFKKFIDIGKLEANHIITMLTSQTNIKPETLEKIGFKELETLYRMET